MTKLCRHFVVTGRVQGVFYRAQTQQQANNLQLTGWVKNLPTGEVEVLACGEHEQIDKLYQWLLKGPKLASVTQINCQDKSWQEFSSFTIVY